MAPDDRETLDFLAPRQPPQAGEERQEVRDDDLAANDRGAVASVRVMLAGGQERRAGQRSKHHRLRRSEARNADLEMQNAAMLGIGGVAFVEITCSGCLP